MKQKISEWLGSSGGSQDTYPELLHKCRLNFDDIYSGLHRAEYISSFDDFLGDLLADEWNIVLGNGGATAGAVSAAKGGKVLLTLDDSAGSVAADGAGINGELNWYAENDELVMEARVQLSAITVISAFVGFTDTKALEAPVISAGSADTITTNATDAVGFMFDSRMTTQQWHLVGVANDVDATRQASGKAPVAATYQKLRVVVTAAGVATFYINDVQVGTAMVAAVTPSVALTPVVIAYPTAASSLRTVSVDYIATAMKRV